MKLSRKALAAVATTFALTTAGLSVPAMAAETTPSITILAEEGDNSEESNNSSESSTNEDKDEDDKDVDSSSSDPKEIRDWVAVFTAVVGALSIAFVFVQKLNP